MSNYPVSEKMSHWICNAHVGDMPPVTDWIDLVEEIEERTVALEAKLNRLRHVMIAVAVGKVSIEDIEELIAREYAEQEEQDEQPNLDGN